MDTTSELYGLKKSCVGSGINHEKEKFQGTIEISPVANGKGSQIHFKAVGLDGAVYHEETSLIGPGFDGKPCLFVLSNNHPAVTPHVIKRTNRTSEGSSYTFAFGEVADRNSFREEITLDLWNDGSIEYKYSWGLPGEEFQKRSGARMNAR